MLEYVLLDYNRAVADPGFSKGGVVIGKTHFWRPIRISLTSFFVRFRWKKSKSFSWRVERWDDPHLPKSVAATETKQQYYECIEPETSRESRSSSWSFWSCWSWSSYSRVTEIKTEPIRYWFRSRPTETGRDRDRKDRARYIPKQYVFLVGRLSWECTLWNSMWLSTLVAWGPISFKVIDQTNLAENHIKTLKSVLWLCNSPDLILAFWILQLTEE